MLSGFIACGAVRFGRRRLHPPWPTNSRRARPFGRGYAAPDAYRACKIEANDDAAGFSLPGIACSPELWRCNDKVDLTNSGPIEVQSWPNPER